MISLDVDPSEDAALLRRYADQNRFTWRLAISPRDLSAELAQRFGTSFLSPTSEPKLVFAKSGRVEAIFGRKSAAELRALVERARSS